MSLPVIHQETPEQVEAGLRNGSTIYLYGDGANGEYRFNKVTGRFEFEFYGECGRYRDPREVKHGESGCLVWNIAPYTKEFDTFLQMAAWAAFAGCEWT